MGLNTKIDWTTHSWNPWQGCHPVSAGCDNCYMHRDKKRYGQNPSIAVRSKNATFYAPMKWIKDKEDDPESQLITETVFVCSWSDFCIEEADEWRKIAWQIIKQCSSLIFIILTKREDRLAQCLPSDWGEGYPNVCLGVTAENQKMADKRIPVLLRIPARWRMASIEPLLGPIKLSRYHQYCPVHDFHSGFCSSPCPLIISLNWIIVGGESGPNARPMHPDWARSVRDQCEASNIPFFFKQWGEWVDFFNAKESFNPKNKNKFVFIDDPGSSVAGDETRDVKTRIYKIGRRITGRLLDGKEHNEVPW